MKTSSKVTRLGVLALVAACIGSSVSCMTTYDAAGRPVCSVDPGVALAGIAAAGVVGYAIADRHHHGGYYAPYYGGGYYRPVRCY